MGSLSLIEGKHFIDGRWVEATGGRTFEVKNPATGEVVGVAADGGREDAKRAVEAAHRAFPEWAGLAAAKRSAVLWKITRLIREHQEELARVLTIEQGKPLAESRAEVGGTAGYMEWYAEEAKRVYGETIPAPIPEKRIMVLRQPVGVVGAITPWNFPSAMITRKIAPALAAGCTVVLKPAEQTPRSAIALFQLFEAAGLPAGVANLVTALDPRPIGAELLDNPLVRKIAFTGSTEVGKLLMRGAADQVKKISLELGGHAPLIVFDDADLDRAVAGAIGSKYRNAGQTCICANRVYVHEKVYDAFTAKLTQKVAELRMGDGLEEGAQVGPLIDEQGFRKVKDHVEDAVKRGARVLVGGKPRQEGPFARGYFFEPTVLADITPEMRICQEETFGPVMPLIPFRDEAEVVAKANDTRYGLAAYFFTRDLSRAWRVAERLEYGIVGLNDVIPAVPQAPFGGVKESGIGREGGRHGLEGFLEIKYISIGL